MDHLNAVIAENLRKVREQKKLSLDHLAKLSGVSKSMLGQIERCEVNPTVSTLWKISNGLKISFSQFIHYQEADVEQIDRNQFTPLMEDDGKVRIYPIFPFHSARRFEIYSVELDVAGYLSTEPHLQGTQEFLTVSHGELTVEIQEKTFFVTEANSIRFHADQPHSYRNTGNTRCTLHMVIYYPE
ncbi:helix-turn-helix domain-containing protein [Faecalispora anaeroviscerum]|uniref:helix-turn-helix domain-containing protein n=1 Tax=Faecalispora anaeroviscerum TaxID=2991836 RepID=UPI0024B9DCD1|nr:XRE family transcriptional regulator [Faecalispora anaeroviscerum]